MTKLISRPKNRLKALAMRFEAPETKNRWDSPLYQLKPEDKIPFEEIENSLFNKRAPPPNKSTLNASFFFFFLNLINLKKELFL